jgi:hypothetical protein
MWKAFAEQFKECGRNGTLFVFALVTVFPVLVVSAHLADHLGRLSVPIFAGFWVILLGIGLAGFVNQWRHPDRLGKLPPLSQNELSKARSKLLKSPYPVIR